MMNEKKIAERIAKSVVAVDDFDKVKDLMDNALQMVSKGIADEEEIAEAIAEMKKAKPLVPNVLNENMSLFLGDMLEMYERDLSYYREEKRQVNKSRKSLVERIKMELERYKAVMERNRR